MLPDYLNADYSNFKRTPNQFQRFHKIVGFFLTLQKDIAAIMYGASRISGYKNQKIERYLFDNFMRPTEGVWLSFIELLMASKFSEGFNISKVLRQTISAHLSNELNDIYSNIIQSKATTTNNNLYDVFQKIVTIKNRYVSHGVISEELAETINRVLEPIADEMIEVLNDVINYKLYYLSEDGLSLQWKVCNYNNNECTDIDFDKSLVTQQGIYFAFGNTLVPGWPLISCRDGSILFYNRFDKTSQKVYFTASNQRETYIRSDANDCAELFGFDSDLLKYKPLDVVVQISEQQVYNNVPQKDYPEFIGRKSELDELEKAVAHPRHFIVALDGIGGVGKSAIAIEYCNRILNRDHSQTNSFEYVIWLSAKSTMLRDGKVFTIDQAFEHLEQLVDTTLMVIGFPEYCSFELPKKRKLLTEILECTKALFVLDNLETIKPGNITEIWDFINNDIPAPSKVLLTSREYHQNVPQTIRLDSLSRDDSFKLIDSFSDDIGIANSIIDSVRKELYEVSSGLPIVIKSILGQIKLGKPFKVIKKEIESNTDNIAKFCFEQQLALLSIDQRTVLHALCLSSEVLNHDALAYIVSELISTPITEIINQLISLSIVKVNYGAETTEYTLLPLIRTYVINSAKDDERVNEVKKSITEYFELRDVESYSLLPIEERSIDKGSLIPRKIVDKAMQFAGSGEFEQAERMFKKATNDYEKESYVWYIYSQFKAQYQSNYKEAITCLKKANEITPNYIYAKKMGDYNSKLQNFQASVKNYKMAISTSTMDKNKQEMLYSIGLTEFEQVRHLRKAIRGTMNQENIEERNNLYKSIIDNLENYISVQPHIYDGKLIRIYRMLSESFFGLRSTDRALEYIDKAIDLSEYDDNQVEYRHFIMDRLGR